MTVDLQVELPTAISRDLGMMIVGNRIGEGASRTVYHHNYDPDLVVKIEGSYGSFRNVYEDQVWERVRQTKLAVWFAPVIRISGSGVVLFMRKTTPCRPAELPKKVPAFFTDLKSDNWGWLDGRVVCHDYGHHLMIEKGMTTRMRNANWEGEQ